jgi:hypothetical protein
MRASSAIQEQCVECVDENRHGTLKLLVIVNLQLKIRKRREYAEVFPPLKIKIFFSWRNSP